MPLSHNFKGKVWFIQNVTCEGPGYFAELLKKNKIPFEIRDREKGQSLPRPAPQDVVVVLGGPMSANDKTRSMRTLLKWIKMLLKRDILYLGICLGLQTLVKAAGGQVVKNKVKEIGFKMEDRQLFVCDTTSAGRKELFFMGIPTSFSIFQLHGETVILQKKMKLLAKGKWCRNQIVKVTDKAFGLQGHLELTKPLLKKWLVLDEDLCLKDSRKLLRDYRLLESKLRFNCSKIFMNFLKISENV